MSPYRSPPRGFTLIETLIAMGVILIGFLGSMSLMSTGQRLNDDARKMTKAVAIGQDLLAQIQTWRYDDPRLLPGARAGRDIFDDGAEFQRLQNPQADHAEGDLGASFAGVPTASLGLMYQRYWNVAYVDDSNGNGIRDGVRIAVIVRWQQTGTWRRIVLTGFKPNTVE